MKRILHHIKNRILAGIILLIPIFVIFTIIKKLWQALDGSGSYIMNSLGLKNLLGTASIPVATTLLLALFFYITGWLVKFSLVTSFRDWIEQTLLQYIPGYLTYKAKMQEKLLPKKDEHQPIIVDYGLDKRPGLLIEERGSSAIVFFPNSPDSNNGQTRIVPTSSLTKISGDAAMLQKSLQNLGKDFPLS